MRPVSDHTEKKGNQSLGGPDVSRRRITRALVGSTAGFAAVGAFSGVYGALTGTGLTGPLKLVNPISPLATKADVMPPFTSAQAGALRAEYGLLSIRTRRDVR
jgi:hypothetical protein